MKNTLLLLLGLLVFLAGCQTDTSETASATEEDDDTPKEIVYNIPDDFELEILYSPKESNDGSWVALAEGANGTFYASDQNGDLYQFKVPAIGEVLDSTQVDTVDLEIGHAHGLLWAFNSLYVSVNERWEDGEGKQLTENGSGVYRLRDTDGDGNLDDLKMLLKLEGAGEHGPHSLVPSPDGESIYFIAGNHTLIPEKLTQNSRLPNTWDEDNLFPPFLDARGHANNIKAPGGWIARMDPEGEDWELIAAGFRNPFDMGFNKDGELFAFDADMEWDIGMPWYRPIRVCHVTSGAEFGWRTGSGKWPAYYPDNLPAVVNLGQGSPTAVLMGSNLNFPAKYKDGMFVFDWSFGTTYYVDLEAKGSSYVGTKEEFFSGTPLPLTDAIAGSDGHMYFASGGRNLDSHFYRLRYTGENQPAGQLTSSANTNELRVLRTQLEASHNNKTPKAIPVLWENLNHTDRHIRYAARVGLEHQPARSWESRLVKEKDTDRIIQASIALARTGRATSKNSIYQKLNQLDYTKLSRSQKLDVLRAYSLTGIRLGEPDQAQKDKIAQTLNAHFPSNDYGIDREISQLLIFLGDPTATVKALELLEKHTKEKTITHPGMLSEEVSNRSDRYGKLILEVIEKMPPTEALFYGTVLSHAEAGWTDDLRERYFGWFYEGLNAKGGLSFKPFFENIRKKAMTNVPEARKAYYEELSGIYSPGDYLANLPQPEGPGGEYNSSDISRMIRDTLKEGKYLGKIETGKLIYEAALCSTCHRMRGEGGANGPDLTQVHTRFKQGELITAIFSPNDEISDQYANTLFYLKDNKKAAGRVLSEGDGKVVIVPNPYDNTYTVELNQSDIIKQELSPISPMPPNLLNRLNKKEIADLFAYLLAGGDEEHFYYGGEKGKKEEKE